MNKYITICAGLIYFIYTIILINVKKVAKKRNRLRTNKSFYTQYSKTDSVFLIILIFVEVILFLFYIFKLNFLMKYNIYINIKIRIAGLIAGIFGVIIIGWASHVLDGEFSETIEIKENHRLITDGPYKHVRHPIYSGFILMHIGITIALSNLLIILFFNIGLFFLLLERIPKEEKVLKDFFGKKWEDYCEKRSMFLPFIKKLTKKI